MPYHDTELAALIEDGRVHRDVYTDKDVFKLEMQRIFARTWVYVGHVSQIKEPGDYITSEIGRVPVVVVRHSDNGIHVIRNRCSHRGAKVAVGTHGHVDEFHCIFHGYTFKTDGTISAIPLEDAYTDTEFDRSDPRVNMQSVAAVDVYRGFVFARLQGGGPDLETWLGDSKISLDNITDRSPDGELECIGEPVRWIQSLQLENAGREHRRRRPCGRRTSIDRANRESDGKELRESRRGAAHTANGTELLEDAVVDQKDGHYHPRQWP